MRLRSDGGGLNSPSPAADRPGQGGVVQAKATRRPRRAQRRKVPRAFGMTAPALGIAGVRGQDEGLAGGEGLRAPEVGGAEGQPGCCGPGRSRVEDILRCFLKGQVKGTHEHRLQRVWVR